MTLKVTTLQSNYGLFEIDTLEFILSFDPGIITIVSFTPSETEIYNSNGNYTLVFKP